MSKPNPRPTVTLGPDLAADVAEYCERTGKTFSEVTRAMWARRLRVTAPEMARGNPNFKKADE